MVSRSSEVEDPPAPEQSATFQLARQHDVLQLSETFLDPLPVSLAVAISRANGSRRMGDPFGARSLAESKQYDAIITLGWLLRGETAHYDAIYTEVAKGIGQPQQKTGGAGCVWSADQRDAGADARSG